MVALYRTTAEDVARLLRTGTFADPIDVVREYRRSVEPNDLDPDVPPWLVQVLPRGINGREGTSDLLTECNYEIGVVLFAHLTNPKDTEKIDSVLFVVEQLQDHLMKNPVLENGGALIPPFTNDPVYDPQKLREQNILMSLSTFTYRIDRG